MQDIDIILAEHKAQRMKRKAMLDEKKITSEDISFFAFLTALTLLMHLPYAL